MLYCFRVPIVGTQTPPILKGGTPVNWTSRAKVFLAKWKQHREIRSREREKRYWNMSEKKADRVSFAIFHELGAMESGLFIDEWRRRKAVRESN